MIESTEELAKKLKDDVTLARLVRAQGMLWGAVFFMMGFTGGLMFARLWWGV